MAPRGRRLSSISLEVLIFLNGWYSATYFLLELFVFMYKGGLLCHLGRVPRPVLRTLVIFCLFSLLAPGLLLPYPTANLVLDVVMLFLYLGIEIIRLFFATKGNLCQRMMPLGISLAMTFPSAMMAFYYFLVQTYVLRLEAVMSAILLIFCGLELVLEVFTLTTFNSMDTY